MSMNRRDFLEKSLLLLGTLSPLSWLLAEKSSKVKQTEKMRPTPALPKPEIGTVLVVGDRSVGKTYLIYSYVNGAFPSTMPPSVLPAQRAEIKPFGTLKGIDTSQDVDYAKADAVVVCFSIVSPSSFQSACNKWRAEIRAKAPKADVFLCGTKMDLRTNPEVLKKVSSPISYEDGLDAAKQFGFERYLETSALNHKGIKNLFDEVAREKLQNGKEGGAVGWMRPSMNKPAAK